jgi:hypothetical protein
VKREFHGERKNWIFFFEHERFFPRRHFYKDFFKHIFIFSLTKHLQLNKKNYGAVHISVTSVVDPDPNPDPPATCFGPPGSGSTSQRYGSGSCSGSGSFYHHAIIVKKNLDSYYCVTLFDFLSLKNDVASKSNKQK